MASNISISGLDDCLKLFDQAPANLLKVSRTAMKEASKATAAKIRRRVPKRWNRIVRYAVDKDRTGKLGAYIGLFQTGLTQGHQSTKGREIPDWFKAYWRNYGTLERRDPNHHFKQPVRSSASKAAARRRNTRGEAPQWFFEESLEDWADTFVEAFEASLKKQEDKLYNR